MTELKKRQGDLSEEERLAITFDGSVLTELYEYDPLFVSGYAKAKICATDRVAKMRAEIVLADEVASLRKLGEISSAEQLMAQTRTMVNLGCGEMNF